MKKLSKKNEALLFHTLAVLSSLLLEYLDKIPKDATDIAEYKENLKLIEEVTEKVVDASYVEEIKSSTYINDLCKKVDTIIRKNFKNT